MCFPALVSGMRVEYQVRVAQSETHELQAG
ncbi:hypothetical protein CE195_13110 [Sodalis-like symbiont of Philaenus spumarius]|nr:hypothetical protein CE195_13110 [Sodalis-like symbiont of Philaenus spumarius]